MAVTGAIFVIMLCLRYYSLGCLIFVLIRLPSQWWWIFVVLFVRIIFCIEVISVSLKAPESKTEIILKTYWNSKESDMHELF